VAVRTGAAAAFAGGLGGMLAPDLDSAPVGLTARAEDAKPSIATTETTAKTTDVRIAPIHRSNAMNLANGVGQIRTTRAPYKALLRESG
jgi:hypothetical protein